MSIITNPAAGFVSSPLINKERAGDARQMLQTRQTAGAENADTSDKTKGSEARRKFLDFLEKTPEQRMVEQWLASHGMTQEEFDALPPEKKEELMEDMQEDFKRQAKQELEKKLPGVTGFSGFTEVS